ncbi:hypothetical protein WA026_002418 [Henosepilachna vigintioctopunctata]|uniref:Acyltransferase 3 domain-containing protein n=1 Tax=Henosepilachna vigintioctopunctata TaxID=420089 RepID=A0AAW1TZD5_9CUCU
MHAVFFIFFIIDATVSLVSENDYAVLPPVFEVDNFDRCMLLGDEALYCTIDFQLAPEDAKNPTETWKKIQELNQNPKNYRHDRLRHGVCVQFTCPNISTNIRDDLEKCYIEKYYRFGMTGKITEMHCQKNAIPPLDIHDIIISFIFIVYAGLIIVASLFYSSEKAGVQHRDFNINSVENVLSCFSIKNNWRRLTTMKDEPDTKDLQCIQGLRFWNMFLVLFSHALLCMLNGPVINTKTVENMMNSESTYLVAGLAPIVTQTFFLLSSWLLTYHVLVRYGDGKQLNMSHLLKILLNRYIRLTPALAVMLAIHTTLPKYIAKGPYWHHFIGREYDSCRKNGWSNLLYINNYWNPSRMCMSQTWYLAADTQLFILGLCILTMMNKYPAKIAKMLGFFLIVGISIPGILCFINGYDILQSYPEHLYMLYLNVEDWHVLFSSGYSNIGALILGISAGYLFYIYRHENIFNTKLRQGLVCVIPLALSCSSASAMFYMNSSHYTYSKLNASLWWSGTKNGLCLAAAIFIFGMTKKLGGFLLWMCCWRPVRYLSRLTYSTFLVHTFLLRIKTASQRAPTYISDYAFMTLTLEIVTMGYIFGLILCITCEMPVSALQKLWCSTEKAEDRAAKKIIDVKEGGQFFNKNE